MMDKTPSRPVAAARRHRADERFSAARPRRVQGEAQTKGMEAAPLTYEEIRLKPACPIRWVRRM